MKTAALYGITFLGMFVAFWLALVAAGTDWSVLYALVAVIVTGIALRKTK
jgi:hypothetical protein